MANYQQTADRVRAFLAGADQTQTDAILELARAYADDCQDTNTRLRRCVDYLHRGLRSEAIQLAECQPNLLEVVAALDLPEVADWEQLCAAYDMPRPSRMMIEAAQELNEAYAQEQPLRNLLVRHRLLSLTKSPLRERLGVLRELAAVDPSNPCWTEDQENFEQARLAELRSESVAVISSRNVGEIGRLVAETSQQLWRVTVPIDLKENLGRAHREMHGEEAIVQLRQMVPAIRSALQAGSLTSAKQLVLRWDQILHQFQVQPRQELTDEILALRQWVSDQEQLDATQESFEAACRELRAILNANVSLQALKDSRRAVEEFGLTVPEDLGREYRQALKRVEKTQRFEQLGMLVVVAAVAVAILAAVLLIIWKTVKH